MPDRPAGADAARALVTGRFPDALQAWLSGSVTTGRATATSDLDVTVLLSDSTATPAHRESLVHDGWPVELFVNTEATIRAFVAADLDRRRPTTARLVGEGLPLLPGNAAAELQAHCRRVLEHGPPPLSTRRLDLARYALTDLLDDLGDRRDPVEAAAVAVEVWRSTAELALSLARHWTGSGKWLVRELVDLDPALAARLDAALRRALDQDVGGLTGVADDVLDRCGGRLWVGFRQDADLGRP